MTRLLLTTLTLTLALSTTACDDGEDDCPQGECVVVRPPTGPDHDNPPVPCPEACANLLGECGTASVKSDEIGDCDRDCRIVFTPDETECMASLTCGEATDVCFE